MIRKKTDNIYHNILQNLETFNFKEDILHTPDSNLNDLELSLKHQALEDREDDLSNMAVIDNFAFNKATILFFVSKDEKQFRSLEMSLVNHMISLYHFDSISNLEENLSKITPNFLFIDFSIYKTYQELIKNTLPDNVEIIIIYSKDDMYNQIFLETVLKGDCHFLESDFDMIKVYMCINQLIRLWNYKDVIEASKQFEESMVSHFYDISMLLTENKQKIEVYNLREKYKNLVNVRNMLKK